MYFHSFPQHDDMYFSHFQPTHMADFSHIQAVQTIVGEVCLIIIMILMMRKMILCILYDAQSMHLTYETAGWARQVSASASSSRQRRVADDHLPEHGRGREHGRPGGRLLQARQPVLHIHMEQERYVVVFTFDILLWFLADAQLTTTMYFCKKHQ